MGKIGMMCRSSGALSASICSLAFGARKKGCDNVLFFQASGYLGTPSTINKGQRKMTNRPCFTPSGWGSGWRRPDRKDNPLSGIPTFMRCSLSQVLLQRGES